MGVDFYLLPKASVHDDATKARDWLDWENRRFGEIPTALDAAVEARKRFLADLILRMKPDFEVWQFQFERIAKDDMISVDEARRKFRYIEINGPGVQLIIHDHHIWLGVYTKIDIDEWDAVLATLSAEGGFVLFDPQSDVVIDLNEEPFG